MSFTREIDVAGKTLSIKQLYIGDVGCVVWDAAIVLTKFLENHLYFPSLQPMVDVKDTSEGKEFIEKGVKHCVDTFWSGKKVVDLGSGTGVVGLAAGILGYVNHCIW